MDHSEAFRRGDDESAHPTPVGHHLDCRCTEQNGEPGSIESPLHFRASGVAAGMDDPTRAVPTSRVRDTSPSRPRSKTAPNAASAATAS